MMERFWISQIPLSEQYQRSSALAEVRILRRLRKLVLTRRATSVLHRQSRNSRPSSPYRSIKPFWLRKARPLPRSLETNLLRAQPCHKQGLHYWPHLDPDWLQKREVDFGIRHLGRHQQGMVERLEQLPMPVRFGTRTDVRCSFSKSLADTNFGKPHLLQNPSDSRTKS